MGLEIASCWETATKSKKIGKNEMGLLCSEQRRATSLVHIPTDYNPSLEFALLGVSRGPQEREDATCRAVSDLT